MKYLMQSIIFSFLLSSLVACGGSGDSEASQIKAMNSANKAYDEGKYTEAYNSYKKSAERGDKRAQFMVALMAENGDGVSQNYETAVYWYQKSWELSNSLLE